MVLFQRRSFSHVSQKPPSIPRRFDVRRGSRGAAGSPARLSVWHDEPQSKSPNERLNVAVVGAKGRGGSHIGAFAGPQRHGDHATSSMSIATIGNNRVNEIEKRQEAAAEVGRGHPRRCSTTRASISSASPRRTTGTR